MKKCPVCNGPLHREETKASVKLKCSKCSYINYKPKLTQKSENK